MSDSKDRTITLRFRGVRGSTPSPSPEKRRYGGNTSCVEVRCGKQLLILDAGTGIRDLGEDLVRQAQGEPITADLLLTHTHWDHIQGLPFFLPAYAAQNRIRLFGANAAAGAAVEEALRNQMSPMHFPVALEQMKGLTVEEMTSDRLRLGHFSVERIALNHPGGCAGLRMEAGGRAFGYLPDHEPFVRQSVAWQWLVDFIHELDFLVLDTQYSAAEYAQRTGWGHGSLPESVALALEANVRRLALFHHDPTHRDHEIDAMVVAARALAPASRLQVQAAAENEVVVLEPITSPAHQPPLPARRPALAV